MKRGGPLKRRTPLHAVRPGKARRKAVEPLDDTEAWEVTRQAVLARDGGCRANRMLFHSFRCWGPLHVHHIRRRSQGGTNDPENLITLCARAHDWVHGHIPEAVQLGLLKTRKHDA